MNIKTSQISMLAAMIMGNWMYASLPSSKTVFPRGAINERTPPPSEFNGSLSGQQNYDLGRVGALCYSQLSSEQKNTSGWPIKLANILGLAPNNFTIYRIFGADLVSGTLLSEENTLLSIAEFTASTASGLPLESAVKLLANKIRNENFSLNNPSLGEIVNITVHAPKDSINNDNLRQLLLKELNPKRNSIGSQVLEKVEEFNLSEEDKETAIINLGQAMINWLVDNLIDSWRAQIAAEASRPPPPVTPLDFIASLKNSHQVVSLPESNQENKWHKIALAAQSPVIVVDTYEGNSLGKNPGGFRHFFNELNYYNGLSVMKMSGGTFFDDNIQEFLRNQAPFLNRGLGWLFVRYKREIYLICFKNV
jgi:hypothetical protein